MPVPLSSTDAFPPPLATDRRGAVAVEFAICSAAFFALLLACAQTVLIFFAQQALQTAAEGGARYIMTGQASSTAMTADQFRNYACGRIPPILDCSKLIVDVRTATSFDALDTSDPATALGPAHDQLRAALTAEVVARRDGSVPGYERPAS